MSSQTEPTELTWKSWLALLFLVVTFSGVLMNMPAPWKAFDFQVLVGKFGQIVPGISFQGKGGFGAQEGFIFALVLIPTLMLALGLIAVAESLGALAAAEKLFRPLLRPLLGIPGMTGIAFVSSFTSSDAGALMTRNLFEEKHITDNERTIFAAYQYAGSAPVTNTVGLGAPLLGISLLPVGIVIGIIILVKIFGANLVRIYLNRVAARALPVEGARP
jgi:nucleoside recognition membrane protein YjiH